MSDPFACQSLLHGNLLQRALRLVDAIVSLYDSTFARAECLECHVDLCAKRLQYQLLVGSRRVVVHQDIEQRTLLTLGERSIYRYLLVGSSGERLVNLLLWQVDFFRYLVYRRASLVFLFKLIEQSVDFIRSAHLVYRQSYDTTLFGQCLEDALANPPHRIRDELKAARLVETLRSMQQSHVALVDEVGQRQPLVLVLLSH